VPPSGAKIIVTLVLMGAAKRNPKEAWDKLFTALKEGDADDPMTKHALKVGKKIFEAIGEKLVEGKNAVVEV